MCFNYHQWISFTLSKRHPLKKIDVKYVQFEEYQSSTHSLVTGSVWVRRDLSSTVSPFYFLSISETYFFTTLIS